MNIDNNCLVIIFCNEALQLLFFFCGLSCVEDLWYRRVFSNAVFGNAVFRKAIIRKNVFCKSSCVSPLSYVITIVHMFDFVNGNFLILTNFAPHFALEFP
jgi:hypothetical protein